MSIDKFGRHIYKHILKKHLTSIRHAKIFFSQTTVKEIIRNHIKEFIESEKLTVGRPKPSFKRRKILSIHSDGQIKKDKFSYYYLHNKGNTLIYSNKFYNGNIIQVHYQPETQNCVLVIDGKNYSRKRAEKTPYKIKKNSVIGLMYVGLPPVPDKTEPVSVEILIEDEEDDPSEEGSSE